MLENIMNQKLLLILAVVYIMFGIMILISPKFGAKVLKTLPWRQGGILNSKLVPTEQKIVRPSIVRLLGAACILVGVFVLRIYL
jgi:uncharacterized membrane protein HdeD (DUF308 family)